jgi:putative hydrolase of HD superfamily
MERFKEFLELMEKIKHIRRTGWVERGVKNAESTADHSFMMALMCMTLPAEGIDRGKAVKMALVHDIAEVKAGDIIPFEYWKDGGSMPMEKKIAKEKQGFEELLSTLPEDAAKEIRELWEEFMEGKTPEASFVRDIDRAECMIQAYRYHKAGNFGKPLEGFWDDNAMSKIRSEKIKELVKNIIGMGR